MIDSLRPPIVYRQYTLVEETPCCFGAENVSLVDRLVKYTHVVTCQPSWRSWLARQSHNLKVVSSSLTEGIFCVAPFFVNRNPSIITALETIA
jgi:hypothetical protein